MIDYLFCLISCCVAYCIGSIPSGYWIARAQGINGIRKHGSGNIGATNVARFLGMKYFFLVFFLDFFKSFLYLWLLQYTGVSYHQNIIAAIFLLIGNGASIFLQCNGGKGVATSFGILLALQPILLGYALLSWLIVFAISRIAGMASIASLIFLALYAGIMLQDFWTIILLVFISVWGLFKHRMNVKALYQSSLLYKTYANE